MPHQAAVLAGHGATIHAATIEDGALVGMGATVLDNSTARPLCSCQLSCSPCGVVRIVCLTLWWCAGPEGRHRGSWGPVDAGQDGAQRPDLGRHGHA